MISIALLNLRKCQVRGSLYYIMKETSWLCPRGEENPFSWRVQGVAVNTPKNSFKKFYNFTGILRPNVGDILTYFRGQFEVVICYKVN